MFQWVGEKNEANKKTLNCFFNFVNKINVSLCFEKKIKKLFFLS